MTTIQFTTTEEINPCKTCNELPQVVHVDLEGQGRSVFTVECCGKSKTNQFLTVAFDSWNFDAKTF